MNFRHFLIVQFSYTYGTLKLNLEGIDHEASLVQPAPAGNCLNWVLGHLVAYRSLVLDQVLEVGPVWDLGSFERYRRGSQPLDDPAHAVRFEELLRMLHASQEKLLPALKAIPDERLEHKAPFSPRFDERETIGSLLPSLTFHEAYHVGQTGLLRRMLGKGGAIR